LTVGRNRVLNLLEKYFWGSVNFSRGGGTRAGRVSSS